MSAALMRGAWTGLERGALMMADGVAPRDGRAGAEPDRDRVMGVTPFGWPSARLTVAVARAGGLGVLDLGRDRDRALAALTEIRGWWRGTFGVRIPAGCEVLPHELPDAVDTIVADAPALPEARSHLRPGRRLLVEVVDAAEAQIAVRLHADGLIARGCEAGGRVGDLTTYVLVQRLAADPELAVPVWAAGGIGLHTAAAAVAGGARGVVLDAQLALVREMDLPAEVAAAVRAMDGSETAVVSGHRIYTRPDLPAPEPARVLAGLGAGHLRTQALPVGQDGAFAGPLAATYKTAGGIVRAVREQIGEHLAAAVRSSPLSPAECAYGRAYPVVQGPMTWVSDRALFAAAVAQDGGLPFLALALMSGEETRRLLIDTAERLGDRPWGVGILGFAPPEIRQAQLAAVREIRPPYALIAGGRPGQAAPLEEAGVSTYLHVSSPALLERLLRDGARRFVFEGFECGGHVGPRGSFPLWEAQLQVLERFLREHGGPRPAAELSLAFAGGIHDERSAAMVAALTGPFAERGAEIKVLMGTSYLFTQEAVAAGAIQPGFQRIAVECSGTALLETSPGHATRCANTPYVSVFAGERDRLEQAGTERGAMWAKLEDLNLGRLRIAGKGLRREGDHLAVVEEDEQRRAGMYMIGQVAALRSDTTSVVALHERVTTGATAFLADRAAELGIGAAKDEADPLDIAVVGLGCVFPEARDTAEYWANILGGVEAITEVPPQRDPAHCQGPDVGPREAGDEPKSAWGGFLPEIPLDATAYGVAPDSLGGIDPAHLLALDVATRALADAGYAERPFDRSRTSVFFGAAGAGLGAAYGFRARLPQYLGEVPAELDEQLPKPTEDSFPGVLSDLIAGRLNLGGPGYTVDAAGAGSLAALDAACKELAAGTSDTVLCGGVDTLDGAHDHLLLSARHALSPSGRCAPFDSGADGITLGEGVGCVVLKRLPDAERDGDRIYAVIKSVAGSSDGHPPGLAEPPAGGQRLALRRAYRRAGVSPSEVGLVEAHGIGTAAGDRTELTALTETFLAGGAGPGTVALGSVKAQIGHTRCAAGVAGLIKAALALHTGVRPATAQLRRPISAWDPDGSPFAFDRTARPWVTPQGRRYAGVSGSGFGGANFHAVLAGYDGAPEPVSGLAQWPAELFLIRGADRAAALEELTRLGELLTLNDQAGRPWRLRDLARTYATSGNRNPVQVSMVATDLDDLAAKLASAREFEHGPGVYTAREDAAGGKVAFLYPGQGSQRPGMLADLFVAFPRLQRLLHLGGGRHAGPMFPPAAFSSEEAARQRAAITDTRVAQPALGIAGLALHRLLVGAGVRPDMAGGHSYGELVALCAAGVFGESDLVELSTARADAVLAAIGDEPGAMAAVIATADETRQALAGHQVAVANHNAPRQTVISGPAAAVDAAIAVLTGRGISAERLPAACAFHSPLVAGAVPALRGELDARDLRSPAYPVWCNSTAEPYASEPDAVRAALAGQVAAPVRFVEQIEAMYAAGARVFVEAGPGRALTQLVGKILGDRPHTAVACDRPGGRTASRGPGPQRARGRGHGSEPRNGLHGLLLAFAELAAAGVPVDPAPLFSGRGTISVSAGDVPERPGWTVDGRLVRTADGHYPANALRPARRVTPPATAPSAAAPVTDGEAAVLEYLRITRELVAAQREVVLGYLAGAPERPAETHPAVPHSTVPAPRPGVPAPSPAQHAAEGTSENASGGGPEGVAEGVPEGVPGSLNAGDVAGEHLSQAALAGQPDGGAVLVAAPAGTVVSQLTPAPAARAGGTRGAGRPPRRHTVGVQGLPPVTPPTPASDAFAGQRFVIVDDGCGIALELADLLERYGARVRTPVEPHGPADGLIHLGALRPGGGAVLPGAYAGIRDALVGGLRFLVLATGSAGGFGHRFDGSGVADPTAGAGLRGLARTVAQEFPDVLVRAVDVDTKDSPRLVAERLFAELLTPEGPVTVGYEGGSRRTLAVTPMPHLEAAPLPLGADGVVLLTGGARGITARVSLALAAATGCHIELLGRTEAPTRPEDPALAAAITDVELRRALTAQGGRTPAEVEVALRRILAEREIRQTLAALRGSAASVRYQAADVRDASAVRAFVRDVYARHGRLDGVIHGAGVLEDGLIRDKAPDSFARVYRTKVDGACALAAAIRPDIGFFVVFGSVAGVYGDRGQADHSAAGEACDTLARVWRTRLRGRVLVADWGPWAGGGGMISPDLARQYDRRGIALLDPEDGVAALLRELASGEVVQVVLHGDAR
ncbi:MAG: beta-ketoacyl synthase [Streptosporangiaceae bacterium]|nr:beta-ketoacyl synthase [Streptosporangiaceae bacterium]